LPLSSLLIRQSFSIPVKSSFAAPRKKCWTVKNSGTNIWRFRVMTHLALYQAFAHYNQIMNQRIYEICSEIPDEMRKQDRGAYFNSIHGTLDHIVLGDRAWMNRLADKNYPLVKIGNELFTDFDEMAKTRIGLDADICQWTEGLTEEWLATPMAWTASLDGVERTQPVWLLVSQIFNHQTHHRGQVSTLLNQAGHDVGITDLPRLVM